MRRAAILTGLALLVTAPALAQEAGAKLYREPDRFIAGPASPAFEQQATPSDRPLDWSKPVIGLDGPPAGDRQPRPDENFIVRPEDAPLPVEVYTLEDLNAQKSPSANDFNRSLTKPEERCDPAKIGVTVQCTAPKDGAPVQAAPPQKPQN